MTFFLVLAFVSIVSGIKVNNGRYEDVYVVITQRVPEDGTLVQFIQEAFTAASQKLFTATKQHLFFGKVHIVVPQSWTTKSAYKQIPGPSHSAKGTIYVDNGENKTPRVYGIPNCGSPGLYMYLHTDFIERRLIRYFGPVDNVIAHEWGHLRWGLYDEYPLSPRFYLNGNQWEPVRCTESVKYTVQAPRNQPDMNCDTSDASRQIDENCVIRFDSNQDVTASLMGSAYIKKLAHFCDSQSSSVPASEQHNNKAPSRHNEKCNGKSTLEIMRTSGDFDSGSTLSSSTDTRPEFELLQFSDGYQVLVLDVSGSMAGERINRLRSSAAFLITDNLANGSWVGIVWFSTTASVKQNMHRITSTTDRAMLVSSLPTQTGGSTCIGCGLEKALDMLTSHTSGSVIYLLSDGENNRGNLQSSINKVVLAGVMINTIAISQAADSALEYMAQSTGGKHFNDLEGKGDSGVGLATLLTSAASQDQQHILLVSEIVSNVTDEYIEFNFTVDPGVGKDTVISVLAAKTSTTQMSVRFPNGMLDTVATFAGSLRYPITGIAKPGIYEVGVNITDNAGSTVEYLVATYPLEDGWIQTYTYLSTQTVNYTSGVLPVVFTDVQKDGFPVLRASVVTHVYTSNGSCSVDMFDNGLDPDVSAEDGTYSGYILSQCLYSGRIAIKTYISGETGQTIMRRRNLVASDPVDDVVLSDVVQDFSFRRVYVAEGFTVTNYDPTAADVTAPSRITDLKLVDIRTRNQQQGENRNFTFVWTAPGDDMNVGKCTQYEIRVAEDISILYENFSLAEVLNITGNYTPSAAGEKESVTMMVDAEQPFMISLFCAVVARDEAGNTGQVSNIISISVARGYRISAIPTPDQAPPDVVYKKDDSKVTLIVVIAVCVGVVMIIIALIFVAMRRWRRKNLAV